MNDQQKNMLHKLSQLINNVKGEVNDFIDFLLSKNEKSKTSNKPQFGKGKGTFVMQLDFDEPLEDFKNYM